MFRVEWLQGETAVRNEYLSGTTAPDALKIAVSAIPRIEGEVGGTVDSIRIYDTHTNLVTIQKIGAE